MTKSFSIKGQAYLPLFLFAAIGYVLYKQISGNGILNQVFGTTDAEKDAKAVDKIIGSIKVDYKKTSFPVQQAKIYAENLQKAMNPMSGWSPDIDGTDEDSIVEIFNAIKNKEDAKAVYSAFGLRQYTTNWFMDNQEIDLVGWIRAETGGSLLSSLQTKLNWMLYE